jgi:hypothetical protein
MRHDAEVSVITDTALAVRAIVGSQGDRPLCDARGMRKQNQPRAFFCGREIRDQVVERTLISRPSRIRSSPNSNSLP